MHDNSAPREQQEDSNRREFDLIIFAASSSVGKFLVEELALVIEKYYSNKSDDADYKASTTDETAGQLGDPYQFAQSTRPHRRRRSVPRQVDSIRWAVAGRSAIKLSETLCRAELSTGIKGLSNRVPIVLADLNHDKSLHDMCAKTRLVINCAGPYTSNGELVIKACVNSNTNYIDLSHETTFIETMRQKYSDEAREAKVFIINGCGFQSMSAEMGFNFTKQVADGQIDEIKIILSLSDTRVSARGAAPSACRQGPSFANGGIVSLGMWRSLLAEKACEIPVETRLALPPPNAGNTRQEDTQFEQGAPSKPIGRLLQRKDTQTLVKDIVQFRNKNSPSGGWLAQLWPANLLSRRRNSSQRGYCWPSEELTSEEAQLIRGEMNNYELRRPDLSSQLGWRPIRCTSFVSLKSFYDVLCLFVWLQVFRILVKFSLARRLMRNFPRLFSLNNVSVSSRPTVCRSGAGGGGATAGLAPADEHVELERDTLSHIKYCQTFVAYGTPSDESGDPLEQRNSNTKRNRVQLLVARLVGPEPNHVASATFAVQAALALLLELDHLPAEGGVLTPGAAFAETNIVYQLRRRNIKFEVLKKA